MVDSALTAEAVIVGGHTHLVRPSLIHGDPVAGVRAVGVEIENKELYEIFGDMIYGEGLTYSLPQCVLELLRDKKLTFSSAESCTGGMIASAITDLPGSSEVFLYGAVTYANSAKVNALGVYATHNAKGDKVVVVFLLKLLEEGCLFALGHILFLRDDLDLRI